ncbi:MAG: hypothetical protein WCR49_14225, partial [Opitutae bacterium]
MKQFIFGMCVLGSVWAAVAQTPEAAPAGAPAVINPRVARFTELLSGAQSSLESVLPEELITLLQEGRDLGRPQMVSGVLRGYLS